ncbi:MAG: regulator [Gammaproteobacteria bacterium]|nr:regulator [Gammaproteobacteria bacterium]
MSMICLGTNNRSDDFRFDTSNTDWKPFVTDGCFYRILDVNVPARTAEMLIKFEPNGRCLYHRHAAAVKTLVLEGDLHLYEPTPNGEVHTIKPAGSFSMGAGGEVHIEGAEEKPVIVYFSMASETDVIYELLDRNLNLKRAITVQDFDADWKKWHVVETASPIRQAG